MIQFKKVKDPYKEMRIGLFKNVEPKVELLGITIMSEEDITDNPTNPTNPFIERIPGFVARMSHASEASSKGDFRLNLGLHNMKPVPHNGPFEFTQWVFRIVGISKSSLTQFDRHRIGVGFVQMSGRYMDRNKTGFIYNTYDYLEKKVAKNLLIEDSKCNNEAMTRYNVMREQGVTKQDARKHLPVSFSSGTYVHLNTVALRNFFQLRLDSHAEWEIRRIAKMIWDKVWKVAPTHFQDMEGGIN